VYVHLDPRADDVMVPSWFKTQPQLVLQIGLNMSVPIPDLDVGQDSISCTLSFNRRPEFCRIPWTAIYGLVGEDGRGMIWPESVPTEVASAAQGRPTSKRPQLRVAEDRAVPAIKGAAEAAPTTKTPGARPSAAAVTGSKATKSRSSKSGRGSAASVEAKRGAAAQITATNAGSSAGEASSKKASPAVPAKTAVPTIAAVPVAASLPSRAEQKPRSHATASGPSGNNATQSAGKRKELPPYLRVVK